jgi:hypothetical protein
MTSKIKVDNINKVSDDSNIIKKCGSTITLGASGDSIALASGASQTGFGRTGTVDWQTGSIKTGTFTAVNGEGYFVDTSGSTSTANLPAGSAGAIVSFSDYTRTFATNKLTISPDGSEKIGGIAQDLSLQINGQALTLVYVDGTEGWINIQNAEDTETGTPPFINASVSGVGNTLATAPDCANMKIATFTGPGDFTVNSISPTPANNAVAYMIVGAGGGGGGGGCGGDGGAGSGAGGFREGRTAPITPYTASPLVAAAGITVTAQTYTIEVGGGGAGGNGPGNGSQGNVSSALGLTSAGGGYGQGNVAGSSGAGGSGGGGRGGGGTYPLGAGNTPPVSPPQGNTGGQGGSSTGPNPQSPDNAAGGGGGATAVGSGAGPGDDAGAGGAGATTSISGSPTAYAGGGGGSGFPGGSGGTGGGGAGTNLPSTSTGGNGTDNTGGGAGGGKNGGTGGSGIVIIRYRFQ